jgi:hypothetical protein
LTVTAVSKDTYLISGRGNEYTDKQTLINYFGLKAAEVTLGAGATHFVVVSDQNMTQRSFRHLPATSRTTFAGNVAYTTYSPGVDYEIVKPGRDVKIRIYKAGKIPRDAFPARGIFDVYNPRVNGPKPKV